MIKVRFMNDNDDDCDKICIWRYSLLERPEGFYVCEEYLDAQSNCEGFTGGVDPFGATPEELLQNLECMVRDIKIAITDKRFIVEVKDEDEPDEPSENVKSIDLFSIEPY